MLLGGCIFFDSGDDGPDVPPDDRPPNEELPAGVWEPVPGEWILDASVAADNGTVWWAYSSRGSSEDFLYEDHIWLGATSPTGESVVVPAPVAPASTAKYEPDLVVTPSAIVAKLGGAGTVLRRYTNKGVPLGDPYPLVIQDGVRQVSSVQNDLIAMPDGGVQLVAALSDDVHEVAIVDLDASGEPTATIFAGTPDTTEAVPSAVFNIAAGARADGTTVFAWDRNYNACISVRPSATMTSTLDGTTVGPIQSVFDVPDDDEARPSIAASGDTAYITWQQGYGNSSTHARIALAKFPDVATVLAEVGDPNESNTDAALTLAEPGRGAIVYKAVDRERLYVVAFEESAGTVKLGAPRIVPRVDLDAFPDSVGLVHVGSDRYVLGWVEHGERSRLYAIQIDLANEALRPAPPFEVRPPAEPRKLRCP